MIREANLNDLAKIIEIKESIIEEMQELANPQWHQNYPTIEDFTKDLENNSLYVYEENNEVVGFVCITKDLEDEYQIVEKSTKADAYIIHRLGIAKNYRHLGIAYKFMKYAEHLAKMNNVYLIKADTEISNFKMNALFNKLNYNLIGNLQWQDNVGNFNYYEKNLERR